MAGLICARTLTDQRFAVSVFDKGREPGGRIATRQLAGYQFDDGRNISRLATPVSSVRSMPGWHVVWLQSGPGMSAYWRTARYQLANRRHVTLAFLR